MLESCQCPIYPSFHSVRGRSARLALAEPTFDELRTSIIVHGSHEINVVIHNLSGHIVFGPCSSSTTMLVQPRGRSPQTRPSWQILRLKSHPQPTLTLSPCNGFMLGPTTMRFVSLLTMPTNMRLFCNSDMTSLGATRTQRWGTLGHFCGRARRRAVDPRDLTWPVSSHLKKRAPMSQAHVTLKSTQHQEIPWHWRQQ